MGQPSPNTPNMAHPEVLALLTPSPSFSAPREGVGRLHLLCCSLEGAGGMLLPYLITRNCSWGAQVSSLRARPGAQRAEPRLPLFLSVFELSFWDAA